VISWRRLVLLRAFVFAVKGQWSYTGSEARTRLSGAGWALACAGIPPASRRQCSARNYRAQSWMGARNQGRALRGTQTTECVLSDLARPQVPQFVTAVCGNDIVTDAPCTRVGDACFVHPAWPYPDGCLCWPTDHGLVWGCAPVFGWFTSTP
jgi:hypothetical protein